MPVALIVEDEPEANRLLSLLVQLRGYQSDSAFTAGEAIKKAQDRPPDIVFLDLMLPDATGYDVCRALKAHRATSEVPVVMVTARLADENRVQSAQVGASEFIPKPYTPDQIFDALSAADAWRRQVEGQPDRGEIPLHTRDQAEPFARLQLLVCLLLRRTPLDEDSVGRVGQALLEIARAAIDWGRQRGVADVATLHYAIEPDRVAFTVADLGGPFAAGGRGEGRLSEAIALGGFDAVDEGPDRGTITLTKRFPSAPGGMLTSA